MLFQVLFHAGIASERSADDHGFTIDDVTNTLASKLIRRHPHVFGWWRRRRTSTRTGKWLRKAERAEKSAAGGGSEVAPVLDGEPFE